MSGMSKRRIGTWADRLGRAIAELMRHKRRPCPRQVMLVAGAVLVGVITGCAPSSIPVNVRVGAVDPQKVFNESNAGKKAKDVLASFSKNRQALIELEEKELRRMEEDFIKQASVLSPNAKQEREAQFRRRMQEYQQKTAELNREVQEKQKDVLETFREKVEQITAKVAKRLGLQVVIDKGRGGPTLYSEEALDISNQVVEEFNKEYP